MLQEEHWGKNCPQNNDTRISSVGAVWQWSVEKQDSSMEMLPFSTTSSIAWEDQNEI